MEVSPCCQLVSTFSWLKIRAVWLDLDEACYLPVCHKAMFEISLMTNDVRRSVNWPLDHNEANLVDTDLPLPANFEELEANVSVRIIGTDPVYGFQRVCDSVEHTSTNLTPGEGRGAVLNGRCFNTTLIFISNAELSCNATVIANDNSSGQNFGSSFSLLSASSFAHIVLPVLLVAVAFVTFAITVLGFLALTGRRQDAIPSVAERKSSSRRQSRSSVSCCWPACVSDCSLIEQVNMQKVLWALWLYSVISLFLKQNCFFFDDEFLLRNIENTFVIPTRLYNPAQPDAGIRIRQILMGNQSITYRSMFTPMNFALLKLHMPIRLGIKHFTVCLPSMRIRLPPHVHCSAPKLLNTASISYGSPLKIEILSNSYCWMHLRYIKFFSYKFVCGLLKFNSGSKGDDIQKRNLLFEGLPLLCKIGGKYFQYGVFDWVKNFNKEMDIPPITIFSAIYGMLDAIEKYRSQHYVESFANHLIIQNF
ncbi:hypothetical protein D917_04649 [Trichinella nativa]|uniref:C2 domain-containing protein n=1 Tax=Trichinella nativa TaxID=6335 RepID=A0A1Y3E7A3_9BILA|nr:hypothetical protein D917_04649 [Trichinella nativa]